MLARTFTHERLLHETLSYMGCPIGKSPYSEGCPAPWCAKDSLQQLHITNILLIEVDGGPLYFLFLWQSQFTTIFQSKWHTIKQKLIMISSDQRDVLNGHEFKSFSCSCICISYCNFFNVSSLDVLVLKWKWTLFWISTNYIFLLFGIQLCLIYKLTFYWIFNYLIIYHIWLLINLVVDK